MIQETPGSCCPQKKRVSNSSNWSQKQVVTSKDCKEWLEFLPSLFVIRHFNYNLQFKP